jgi:hypothetical protein
MSEEEFLANVRAMASLYGVLAYHTHDSRRSDPGFPDLVLVGRFTEFWELKTETGKVSPHQRAWIDCLIASGQSAHVFRPSDWDVMHARMRKLAPNATVLPQA